MRNFFVLLLLTICLFSGALAQQEQTEEQKFQSIQKKLEQSKEKLKETKKEEQAVLGRLVIINKELKQTQTTLNRAHKKIESNRIQVGVLSSEIQQKKNNLNEKEGKLKSRLKEVYRSSGLNYLELLFFSRSMSDFFNRLYFFGKVIAYDAELLGEIRGDLWQVNQKKNVLQAKTREIQDLAEEVSKKEQDISSKAEEKQKVYEALRSRRQEYEAQVAELEKSSKELEVLILKKVASRKGGKVLGSGSLAWPLLGRLTSYFGYRRHPYWGGRSFHTGLDIANKYGTPIMAADAGEVIFAGWWDGYGKAVVIDHARGTTTVYGHLSRIYQQVGAVVAKGQIIGLVGSTGYSTGPHLHFEVRKNGKPVNPMGYLK